MMIVLQKLLIHVGLYAQNRDELDTMCKGAFTKFSINKAWDLLETIYKNKEAFNSMELNKEEIPIEYDCIRKFLHSGKVK